MAKEYVDFKETVELFVNTVVTEINSGKEIPKVNFIFPESAFKLFNYVKENPFKKEGSWTPDIEDKDIERLRLENQQDTNSQTIYVNDPVRFFELLTELVNSWLDFKEKYYEKNSGRAVLIHQFKRLLLRMGVQDFYRPEEFLQKQIDFFKCDIWDDYIIRDLFFKSAKNVGTYENAVILAAKKDAQSWCETSEKMTFVLTDGNLENSTQTLPSIYYGIREENGEKICYIYAIQNERDKVESKKIQRRLYKLNKGLDKTDVHPSQVLVLETFASMLKEIGITKIKVPARQVLSYSYHELLSEEAKKTMTKWTPEYLREIEEYPNFRRKKLLEEYEWDKVWSSHVIDKADFIEKAKTEGLFKIFYRVSQQFGSISVLNDPFIEDEYMNVRINREKVLSKSRNV